MQQVRTYWVGKDYGNPCSYYSKVPPLTRGFWSKETAATMPKNLFLVSAFSFFLVTGSIVISYTTHASKSSLMLGSSFSTADNSDNILRSLQPNDSINLAQIFHSVEIWCCKWSAALVINVYPYQWSDVCLSSVISVVPFHLWFFKKISYSLMMLSQTALSENVTFNVNNAPLTFLFLLGLARTVI